MYKQKGKKEKGRKGGRLVLKLFLPSCRRRIGPHICLSGFGSGCCPGWIPSPASGQCTLRKFLEPVAESLHYVAGTILLLLLILISKLMFIDVLPQGLSQSEASAQGVPKESRQRATATDSAATDRNSDQSCPLWDK